MFSYPQHMSKEQFPRYPQLGRCKEQIYEPKQQKDVGFLDVFRVLFGAYIACIDSAQTRSDLHNLADTTTRHGPAENVRIGNLVSYVSW